MYKKVLNSLLERINRGESVNIVDKFGNTALIRAAYIGELGIVNELLKDKTIDPNILNISGDNALILASYQGYVDIVRDLLKHGKIDPNIVDRDGKTALDYAKDKGYREIESLLNNFKKVVTFEDMGW